MGLREYTLFLQPLPDLLRRMERGVILHSPLRGNPGVLPPATPASTGMDVHLQLTDFSFGSSDPNRRLLHFLSVLQPSIPRRYIAVL